MSYDQEQDPYLYAAGPANPFEVPSVAAEAGGGVSDRMGHAGVMGYRDRSDALPGVVGAPAEQPVQEDVRVVTNQTTSHPGAVGSGAWREEDNGRWVPAVQRDPSKDWMSGSDEEDGQ